jgi:hypothetical protein
MGGRFRLKTKVGNLLVTGNTDPWPGARSLVLLCDDPDARNDVESLKDIDIDYVIPASSMKWPRPRCPASCCAPTRERVSSLAIE